MKDINRNIAYEDLEKLNRSFVDAYKEGFNQFLASGWYILGNEVKSFENNFANYCESKHFSGLASGLDALFIALKIFKFKPNSEVIVPSNTYIATILAILNNGLQPVLVEPDIQSYNIDPKKIEQAITSKTVAIMPVHLYGKCCNMRDILKLASQYNLKVIEDVAQAHGAKFEGQKAGTFGDFGAFSFYPTKNLGALGDGGGLTTNDEALDLKVRMIRNYGSRVKYYNEVSGINSRLDEIQAYFLNVKLRRLDEINDHKRKLAKLYLQNLSSNFILPQVENGYHDVYHIFNVRCAKRDELRTFLAERGVKTEIHYPLPPHQQKALAGIVEGSFPISEEIHKTTLSLPISFCHNEEDINYVIEVMNQFKL
jgi:dTDP-4-amino-4,6-dideoxygalactose transaminase